MTVFGSNLNAVQNPLLSVSITGHHRHFHDVRKIYITLIYFLYNFWFTITTVLCLTISVCLCFYVSLYGSCKLHISFQWILMHFGAASVSIAWRITVMPYLVRAENLIVKKLVEYCTLLQLTQLLELMLLRYCNVLR